MQKSTIFEILRFHYYWDFIDDNQIKFIVYEAVPNAAKEVILSNVLSRTRSNCSCDHGSPIEL